MWTAALPAQQDQCHRHRSLLRSGHLVNHYQPIVGLCSGRVTGVEVLTRLCDGTALILPGCFLGNLDLAHLDELLFRSLAAGTAMLHDLPAPHADLTMSFNVSPTMLMQPGFADRVLAALRELGTAPDRIMLEILEHEEFLGQADASMPLRTLRDAGIAIALDDVGTGYSSLMRLKELPVDAIKLDQAFVRNLLQKPEDLQFVASMMSLSRGLRKRLIVEGVETGGIANALQVLGVDAAQGYAIAPPMHAAALHDWLSRHVAVEASRLPNSLLGAYAVHLVVIEGCRLMMSQATRLAWPASIDDPHACMIGRYLDATGLHETELGLAHKRFHGTISTLTDDQAAWNEAADAMGRLLAQAVTCEAASAARQPGTGPAP